MTLLKTYFLYTLLLLSLLVTSSNSSGQIFPATANVQLKPPYSLYINDYYDPMSDNLKIVLVFNDNTEPFWEVKLRMRIESNNVRIITKEGYTPPAPITVTPGVPLILSGSELEDYFNYNTILVEGVSVQALLKNGRLPEGFYTFCFEVLDYHSGKVLSKKSCANAWLKLNDPPRVITPACGAALSPMLTQHNFQWQLFNTKSPNSLSGPEYKLFIYEMLDPTANPLTALANGNFLQVFESDYLQTPYFIYDLAAPPLELGKRYFYRVQATDPNGKDAFKNDGFSEVCSFFYGYPEGGKIKLLEPAEGNVFEGTLRSIKFQWEAPDNKQKTQLIEYVFKIIKKGKGQSKEQAFEKNDIVYTKKNPPTTSGSIQTILITPDFLQRGQEYVWYVTAFLRDTRSSEECHGFF